MIPEHFSLSLLRASVRQIAQEVAMRIYAFEMDKSLSKATEDMLSYALQISYNDANDGIHRYVLWRRI